MIEKKYSSDTESEDCKNFIFGRLFIFVLIVKKKTICKVDLDEEACLVSSSMVELESDKLDNGRTVYYEFNIKDTYQIIQKNNHITSSKF